MKQEKFLLRVWTAGVMGTLVLCILLGFSGRASASEHINSEEFEVFIGRPAKGESFYSGPTTLLYSIPINGWVVGYGEHPEEVVIQLEILKNGEIVEQGESLLRSDGTFLFYANVNPEYSEPLFSPEAGSCASTCHVLASMDLPGGDLIARVTVVRPDGASAEKMVDFTVDYSHYAFIQVALQIEGGADLPLENIPIVASTRLYLWRGRTFLGETSGNGEALVRVETLSEAPTTYLVEVEPVVVDGVLYESMAQAQVNIDSNDDQTAPVTLSVRARMGSITGQLRAAQQSVDWPEEITAIALSDGHIQQVSVSSPGEFKMTEVPIDRYLFVFDTGLLEERHLSASIAEVDLFSHPDAEVLIPMDNREEEASITISGEGSQWLPFAWLQAESGDFFRMIEPDSSQVTFPSDGVGETMEVSAPGFYSTHLGSATQEDASAGWRVELVPQPELQRLPWGEGELLVPAASNLQLQAEQLYLDYGWLWGQGGDSQPLQIRVRGMEISLESGRFALEVLPNERVWLYLFEGQALVSSPETGREVVLGANQMINLESQDGLYALDYHPDIPAFVDALDSPPLPNTWKPTVWSKIKDFFGNLGVGIAQIITIVTYSLVLLSLFGFPIYMIIRKWRHR